MSFKSKINTNNNKREILDYHYDYHYQQHQQHRRYIYIYIYIHIKTVSIERCKKKHMQCNFFILALKVYNHFTVNIADIDI